MELLSYLLICLPFLLQICPHIVYSSKESYDGAVKLLKVKFRKNSYNPSVRPLFNQSRVMEVSVVFSLISILQVNEVFQSFTVNGLLAVSWNDELLAWNPEDYTGAKIVYPNFEDVWKPHIGVINTLEEREPFQQHASSLRLSYTGYILWLPGDIFVASCSIDPTKYPFDEQVCSVQFTAMNYMTNQLKFVENRRQDQLIKPFYIANSNWELLDIRSHVNTLDLTRKFIPLINISFHLKRRTTYPLLIMVLPVTLMSFLTILVFVIPAASEEKICYGITVVLAEVVFMMDMSYTLSHSSLTVPFLKKYWFLLLLQAIVTVIGGITDVALRHLVKMPEVGGSRKALKCINDQVPPLSADLPATGPQTYANRLTRDINWKQIGSRLSKASFIISFCVWLGTTVAFFIITMSSL